MIDSGILMVVVLIHRPLICLDDFCSPFLMLKHNNCVFFVLCRVILNNRRLFIYEGGTRKRINRGLPSRPSVT